MREDGVEFQTPGDREDARKRSRSERRKSKNPRGEKTPFGEKDGANRGKSTPKRERADGLDRRTSRDFMKMVNGFMVKIGGKEE